MGVKVIVEGILSQLPQTPHNAPEIWETVINTTQTGDQYLDDLVALPDGGWLAFWVSPDTSTSWNAFFQRYSATGEPVGSEQAVDLGTSGYGRYFDIRLLQDGRFIVTWQGSQDLNFGATDIYCQIYARDGAAIGAPIVLDTQSATTPTPLDAVADPFGGGWTFIWQDSIYLYASAYDETGDVVGNRRLLSSLPSAASMRDAVVTSDGDGGYFLTWSLDYGAYSSRNAIQFAHFDAWNLRIGTTITASTTSLTGTSDMFSSPQLTMLADGGWVVAWTLSRHLPDGAALPYDSDIYLQRFDASGARVGGETLVNSTTLYGQDHPQVVALQDGGWIVVWESDYDPYGDTDILAQRYLANGDTFGHETLVNTYWDYGQFSPHVTAIGRGDIVIGWSSDAMDSDGTAAVQSLVNVTPAFRGTGGADTMSGFERATWLDGLGGDDLLQGNIGADTLWGGAGNDTIIGGQGNDQIWGEGGQNLLFGGAGDDLFVFSDPKAYDRVADFQAGSDWLDLLEFTAAAGFISVTIGTQEQSILRQVDGPPQSWFIRAEQHGAGVAIYLDDQPIAEGGALPVYILLQNAQLGDLAFSDFIFW